MYVIKAQTFAHYGSWDEFVGIVPTLADADIDVITHSQYYDSPVGVIAWSESDEGLTFMSDGGIEYTAILVELL